MLRKIVCLVLLLSICSYAGASFKFIAFSDTQTGYRDLSGLSDQIISMGIDPSFIIFPGDLFGTGFEQGEMTLWRRAFDGEMSDEFGNYSRSPISPSNHLFELVLPVRGNHDNLNVSGWQNYFNIKDKIGDLGGTNYNYIPGKQDLVYAFDFMNSRFIGLDVPGDAYLITNEQLDWLDTDLQDAEARGLVHAFIFFHGPIFCTGPKHCCTTDYKGICDTNGKIAKLIEIINNRKIITATFHGHEHTLAYTYLTSSRIPSLTNPFYQFVVGGAGSGPQIPYNSRYDYYVPRTLGGFALVEVDSNNVTVEWYIWKDTNPKKTLTFSQEIIYPSSDINDDGFVDIRDMGMLMSNWNKDGIGDLDKSGIVDSNDIDKLIQNWYD